MSGIFKFKQFAVNQTGCAMKVNTDGVLLGALANADSMHTVLDIGTGTGVIALMLAQRFPDVQITGVEIDEFAAQTAKQNFAASPPYANRLTLVAANYIDYLTQHLDNKFDCIISNPPFYLQSLKSPQAQKAVAKHTDEVFFEKLINTVALHLTPKGQCWLILPAVTAAVVYNLAKANKLMIQQIIYIKSFNNDEPHREIISLGFTPCETIVKELVIYDSPKVYSKQYQELLKDFLIIF